MVEVGWGEDIEQKSSYFSFSSNVDKLIRQERPDISFKAYGTEYKSYCVGVWDESELYLL